MRYCAHCGAQNPDNAKFCAGCGAPLDGVPAGAPNNNAPNNAPYNAPQNAPQEGKGFFHYVWLYIKIIALAVVIVLAAVAIKGLFTKADNRGGEPLPPDYVERPMPQSTTQSSTQPSTQSSTQPTFNADDLEGDGFEDLADLSESDLEEYLKNLQVFREQREQDEAEEARADKNFTTAQVGLVKFQLAGDYKIASKEHMQNAEACIIVPRNATNMDNRLKVVIIGGEPTDKTGFTSEEIGYFLKNNLADLVEEITDGKYDVHYEDNADGKYFPHCYCFLNLKKGNKISYTYTQSTFVSGNVVTGCAVATDEAELEALMDIYSAVVIGAFI